MEQRMRGLFQVWASSMLKVFVEVTDSIALSSLAYKIENNQPLIRSTSNPPSPPQVGHYHTFLKETSAQS